MQERNFHQTKFNNLKGLHYVQQNQSQRVLQGKDIVAVQIGVNDIPYPILNPMKRRAIEIVFNGRVSDFLKTPMYRISDEALELYERESNSDLFDEVKVCYDKKDWGYCIVGIKRKDFYLLGYSHTCFSDINSIITHATLKLAPHLANVANKIAEDAESHAHLYIITGDSPYFPIEESIKNPNFMI
jgi:hypothetical protein